MTPLLTPGVILQEIVILKLGGAMTTHFEYIFLNFSMFVIWQPLLTPVVILKEIVVSKLEGALTTHSEDIFLIF